MENKPDEVRNKYSLVTIDHLRAVALLMKWREDYWPVIEGNETISYKIEFQKNLRLRLVYSQPQDQYILDLNATPSFSLLVIRMDIHDIFLVRHQSKTFLVSL